jgi:hypothetical protein
MSVHRNIDTGVVTVTAVADGHEVKQHEIYEDFISDLARPHGFGLTGYDYIDLGRKLVIVLQQQE